LLLGANEEDRLAICGGFANCNECSLKMLRTLGKVKDMNAISLGINERRHLWIPAPGLVPEVGADLQKFAHRNCGHGSPHHGYATAGRHRDPEGPPLRGDMLRVRIP
jgi:hypothetical protein